MKTAFLLSMLVILGVMPLSSQVCTLPPDPGPCQAVIPRFYYDMQQGDCLPFVFGGCQGNANNFLTYELCLQACQRPIPTTSEWGLTILVLIMVLLGTILIKFGIRVKPLAGELKK